MEIIDKKSIKALLQPRKEDSHKGDYGHAYIIAGNQGKMGAACIASTACLRTGVGLLTVNVPSSERTILQTYIPEAMLAMRELAIDLDQFDAIAIGPGLGVDIASKKILLEVLKKAKQAILLDADALNLIALQPKLLNQLPKNSVLTPHPKEFDRIFGVHKSIADRRKTAIKKAKEYGIVIVLKGHQSMVTWEAKAILNNTGNAGLAKGGSGDCLSGMITALLAQGYKSSDAAIIGVYLHGLAADLTLKHQSLESMLISDVVLNIGKAFKKVMN